MLHIKGKIIYLIILLLSLYLILCGKGPTKTTDFGNDAPDTYISEKTLTKVDIGVDTLGNPTDVNTFDFSVVFVGVDLDGRVDSFTYRIDSGSWTKIGKNKVEGTFEFATATEEHYFEVYATDDKEIDDPTPAKAVFSLTEILVNKAPTTAITSGPSDGMSTGPGVGLGFSGSDEDGFVTKFVYRLDGGTPVEVSADDDGKANVGFGIANNNALSIGNHSLSVCAVDNYGKADESPAFKSFMVKEGFSPVINFTAGPADGGAWFSKVDAVFSFGVTLSHYAGNLNGYSYAFDSETTFSDWSTESMVTIQGEDITDGDHYFILKAKDTGGSISQSKISFSAAGASFTKDIVLVDLCNSGQNASNDEIKQLFADIGYPIDAIGVEGDNSFFTPGELGKYKTAVAFTDNGYKSYELLIGAYVKAGGNLFFSSYNFVDNFSSSYRKETLGISSAYKSYGTSSFAGVGVLEGLSITLGSMSYANLLRGDSRPEVHELLYGSDGSYMNYARGVFVDNASPKGKVFSLAQSFRRLKIAEPTTAPMIKAIMDLLTGVTSVQ